MSTPFRDPRWGRADHQQQVPALWAGGVLAGHRDGQQRHDRGRHEWGERSLLKSYMSQYITQRIVHADQCPLLLPRALSPVLWALLLGARQRPVPDL